jgi:hypothetical protein
MLHLLEPLNVRMHDLANIPYFPSYNTLFSPSKTNLKIAVHLIHGK